MRKILGCCLTVLFLAGCKKEHGSRIDIYLLKSFSAPLDASTTPPTISITNAVLDDAPLVADEDILFYVKSTSTFILKKDIQTAIQNYGPDKAFAVTVDHQPVYYGKFHPLYLSSITFGVATIAPFLYYHNEELKIDFATFSGAGFLQQLDKRNDDRIINTLKATDRLK